MKDFLRFAIAALRKPAAVGTLFPATHFLAEAMLQGVQFKPGDYVVELGPGTGPITQAIDKRLVEKDRFIGIDLHKDMIEVLRENFPHLRFAEASAERMSSVLPAGQKATHIFSGLPWALFPERLQESIMSEVVRTLAPNGVFIAYGCSHGLFSPSSRHFQDQMRRHFGKVEKSMPVWLNLPPASVFRASELKTPAAGI